MSINQRLDLRQSQSLVMTPQLQQAIKLLQLSNLELTTYLEGEIERNPLLVQGEDDNIDSGLGGIDNIPLDSQRAQTSDTESFSTELSIPDSMDFVTGESVSDQQNPPLDTDNDYSADSPNDQPAPYEGNLPNYAGTHSSGGSFEGDDWEMEQRLSQKVSLRDHLEAQIRLEILDPRSRLIALQLLDGLDAAGYCLLDLQDLAKRLGCSFAQVEAVLLRLQSLEPVGVFARSLSECLAIQLRDCNRLDPAMQILLDNLPLLARRDAVALRTLCGVDSEDLTEMVAEIRNLNPRPASNFDTSETETIIPDILMRSLPNGEWLIELNPDTLPRVLFDQKYHAQVSQYVRNHTEKEYLAQCSSAATWLVKSLHQRATTILRVTTEIVRRQDKFFRQGILHLKPLILRDIAEIIGMHESTVSRVTTNKFIATPIGTFELKYFFTASIAGSDGISQYSSEVVRHQIKNLIDQEHPDKILSDDRIVALLRMDGVEIARRTVAKYREAMRITSSVQRRREKSVSSQEIPKP